jgi:carboxypeptidase Taq
VQQVPKRKLAARSRLNAGKSMRNRRSAEQMLVELKQHLREISDLNAAADVLSWDQATYMPEGGAGARGRQRAMLSRLALYRLPAKTSGDEHGAESI